MSGVAATTLDERVAQMTHWLRLFIAPDQVTELRALGARTSSYRRPHTEAGFFDGGHLENMARAALALNGLAKGIYFVLNPLNPQIVHRRFNRVDVAEEGELAKDKDVLARRWLLIDVDPVRDARISASDAEKAEALETIRGVREHLGGLGWPSPIVGDSGNGYHLLYRIDLPAEDGRVVERILNALGDRFDTPTMKIDRAVFNPARICKLPGTLACKGDNTNERSHRVARILEGPGA